MMYDQVHNVKILGLVLQATKFDSETAVYPRSFPKFFHKTTEMLKLPTSTLQPLQIQGCIHCIKVPKKIEPRLEITCHQGLG